MIKFTLLSDNKEMEMYIHMLVVLQLMLSGSAAAKQPECSLLVFCQVQNDARCHGVADPCCVS